MIKHLYTCLFFFLPVMATQAQNPAARDFSEIDAYVQKLGKLDSMNMGTISKLVTKPYSDKIDKARAIYYWITHNIAYDVKSARTSDTRKNTPTEVLLYRKAVGIGFASLFQDMCSSADIRCLTADGFVRHKAEEIGEKGTEINHSWAVVQLGQSPDTWYYVDPAWGSGYVDDDQKIFTPQFNAGYFFANKTLFNWQHYPDNEAWKLGPGAPKNKGDFYDLPILKGASYDLGLKQFTPKNGRVKTTEGGTVTFTFSLNPDIEVNKVTIIYGQSKRTKTVEATYTFTYGNLSIKQKFEQAGDYPVTIIVNDKPLAVYRVEAD